MSFYQNFDFIMLKLVFYYVILQKKNTTSIFVLIGYLTEKIFKMKLCYSAKRSKPKKREY